MLCFLQLEFPSFPLFLRPWAHRNNYKSKNTFLRPWARRNKRRNTREFYPVEIRTFYTGKFTCVKGITREYFDALMKNTEYFW